MEKTKSIDARTGTAGSNRRQLSYFKPGVEGGLQPFLFTLPVPFSEGDSWGSTQQQAARLCGTDQPTLSKAFRGRMEGVTIDRLASWLNALGRDVEIIVKSSAHPPPRPPARG